MTYAQVLRLRRALLVYGWVVGGIFLVVVLLGHLPNASFDVDTSSGHHTMKNVTSIHLSGLLFLTGWSAIIFATVIGTSLNKENDGVEMVWTKPIERGLLAVRYIALDFGAILAAYAVAVALCLLALGSFGLLKYLIADDRTAPTLVIGLGVAFMWYGLMQALSSWQPGGRGGMIIGLSWAAAFVLASLAGATAAGGLQALHPLFVALDVVNPLAYFSSYALSGYGAHQSPVLPQALAGTAMRELATWSIGIVCCVAAVAGWKRLEV